MDAFPDWHLYYYHGLYQFHQSIYRTGGEAFKGSGHEESFRWHPHTTVPAINGRNMHYCCYGNYVGRNYCSHLPALCQEHSVDTGKTKVVEHLNYNVHD